MLVMTDWYEGQVALTNWQGTTALVIGAARQGLAATRFLIEQGAHVILNDQRQPGELTAAQAALSDLAALPGGRAADQAAPLTWALGGHPVSLLDGVDMVCVSGGVPLELPLIHAARQRGLKVTNDSQIFLQAAPCLVIGITGSAGKTTTTSLVGQIARAALSLVGQPGISLGFEKVWVGGNIGSPLIAELDQIGARDLAVMELSSFQLELMDVSPQVAVILNLTPNHLDRHGTMQAYAAAKQRILDFQTPVGTAVLSRDDPGAWEMSSAVKGRLISFGLQPLPEGQTGVYLRDGQIFARTIEPEIGVSVDQHLLPVELIRLRGEHNLQNVLAACAVAMAVGIPAEAIQVGVAGFTGVPHRLEFVRNWGGAAWYNDSIATAPERAMADIRSFDEPLVLLAGGRDKDLPWDEFARLVLERVDHLIVFGEAAEKILAALSAAMSAAEHQPDGRQRATTIERCAGLHDAVQAAARIASPGDVVLLAPGGTSFDEFRDFEERGRCFAQWVAELP